MTVKITGNSQRGLKSRIVYTEVIACRSLPVQLCTCGAAAWPAGGSHVSMCPSADQTLKYD